VNMKLGVAIVCLYLLVALITVGLTLLFAPADPVAARVTSA
jgi:hypothetical protein